MLDYLKGLKLKEHDDAVFGLIIFNGATPDGIEHVGMDGIGCPQLTPADVVRRAEAEATNGFVAQCTIFWIEQRQFAAHDLPGFVGELFEDADAALEP